MQTTLQQATASIFEQVAFLFPEEPASEEQLGAPLEVVRAVEFRGPICGALEIRVFGGILPAIAANMLGEMDEVGPELQADALGELANVICGSVVGAVGGPDAVFALHVLPAHGGDTVPAGELIGHSCVGLDAGRAEVRLYVDAGAEPSR